MQTISELICKLQHGKVNQPLRNRVLVNQNTDDTARRPLDTSKYKKED